MPRQSVIVKCYSGHTYAERPRSFRWREHTYDIDSIARSWQEPGERHFIVRTVMNILFHLCYNERHEEWSIITPGGEGGNNAQGHPEIIGE